MFILRTIFWLGVIILLLPGGNPESEGADRSASPTQTLTTGRALDAAHATVEDLSSFCQRNPDTCEVGAAALAAAEETAKYGVRAIYHWATSQREGETGAVDAPAPAPATSQRSGLLEVDDDVDITGSVAVAANQHQKSRNTLKIEDVIPEWSGPGTRRRA